MKELYLFVKELNIYVYNVVMNIRYKNIRFYIYIFLCNDCFVFLIYLIFNFKNRFFYSYNVYLKKLKVFCIYCLYK